MRRLATCLAFLAFAAPAAAWDLDQLNKRADENLFQVGDGCSGTLVDVGDRLIFTAYHCITEAVKPETEPKTDSHGEVLVGPDGKPITVRKRTVRPVRVSQFFWDAEGKRQQADYWAEIVARNEKMDVAILRIPKKVGPLALSILASEDVPLAAKDYMPQRGSTVWHIGNPMMLYGSVTKGIMSSARSLADYGFEANKFYIQFDGGMTGGSSGGAIYDDTGTFIGITVMGAPAATFIGLAVPMSDVWSVAESACIADLMGGENPAKCKPRPAPVP